MDFILNRTYFSYCIFILLTLLLTLYFFDNSYGSEEYIFDKRWHTSCDVTEGNWACDPAIVNADGSFRFPTGIAIDKDGNVYVADSWNNRIQKFTSDGTFITKWGSTGSGDGEFRFPTGIAIDKDGNVYVADFSNNRIQKFTSNGTFITQVGSIEWNDNTRSFEGIFDLKLFNQTIIVSDSRTDSIEIVSIVK
jgi:DNA-binding beta-propeller fold protein YncE